MSCPGEWRAVLVPRDCDGLEVLRCTGCSDYLVIVNGRGYDVKDAANARDAVRDAMRQRTLG